jgi:D-alanine-D-alanine ligase
MTCAPDPAEQRTAVLHQALPAPRIGGLRKDAKPGGYSDTEADVGFVLREAGSAVTTPVPDSDPATALDWVFPDTPEG